MCCLSTMLVSCSILFGESAPDDVLNMLVATQQRTLQAMERLSFDSIAESTEYVAELGHSVVVNTSISVRNQSGTRIVTWAADKHLVQADSGSEGRGGGQLSVLDEPVVQMFLQTPEYFIMWQDVSKPEAILHVIEQWRAKQRDPVAEFGQLLGSADLARDCLGLDLPYFELYGMGGEWKVLEFDPEGTTRISRDSPRTDGSIVTDLFLTFHSQTGFLTEASYLSGTPNARILSINYIEHAAFGRVPSILSATDTHRKTPKPRQLTRKFENFSDLSHAPPFTIQDLKLPVQATLVLRLPDATTRRQVWNGQSLDKMKWRTDK